MSLPQIHRTCRTLPLDSFIQAHCNDNLEALIISGSPTPQQLNEVWRDIVSEYSSLINTGTGDEMFSLAKEIGLLQYHVIYVHNAIALLRLRYSTDVVHELIRMGYDGVYDEKDDKGLNQQLDRVTSLCKTKVHDLEMLTDHYNRLQNTSTGKKQSEEGFLKVVFAVAQFQGYPIDRKATTVEDFALMYSNYVSEMNLKKKEVGNG